MTIWMTMTLLVGAGLVAIALPDKASARSARSRVAGGMVALTLLALIVLLGPDAAVASGELAQSRLARLAVGAVLVAFAIGWPGKQRRSDMGQHLMVIAGGVMAVSANSLLTLWIGLILLLFETDISTLLDDRWSLLGVMAVLSGMTLLYAATGELHLDAVGRYVALYAGPQPVALIAGLGLLVIGIALVANLLGPSSTDWRCSGRRMLLGLVLLLRVAGHLPTLWWEWRWMLGMAAVAQAVITLDHWLLHGSRQAWEPSWLWMLQSAMLLLALAFCQSPLGLMAVLGLALLLLLSMAAWRLLAGIGVDPGSSDLCVGLISKTPGPGIALAIALLNLAGLPLSLGLQTRLLLVQVLVDEGAGGQIWLLVAAFCLFGALHVPNLVALFARDHGTQPQERLTWAHLALYALAAATVALGVSATPLSYLARWLLNK